MITSQIRNLTNEKFVSTLRSSFCRPMTLKENLQHKWNCLRGFEKRVQDVDGNKIYTSTESGRIHTLAKEKKMEKEYIRSADEKSRERTVAISTPVSVRVRRGLRISLFLPIALLALRHLVPAIEQDIPMVYQFRDTVVVPIIEWFYAVSMKAFTWLMNQPWFKAVIDALAGLVE